jgi:hypothetical protein
MKISETRTQKYTGKNYRNYNEMRIQGRARARRSGKMPSEAMVGEYVQVVCESKACLYNKVCSKYYFRKKGMFQTS